MIFLRTGCPYECTIFGLIATVHLRRQEIFLYLVMVTDRVGPIYWLADIFGQYRYRYISIGKLDISIGHNGIGICIGYSGYRLYWYRQNIG